ncbi:MAG: serine/threonine-protein kinase, partial [Myxococcota bacterium]
MGGEVLVDRGGRRYELVARLGEGGFGVVYLAQTTTEGGLPRRVALKLLRHQPSAHAQAAERLRDEAAMIARLDHPAIVHAFDLVEIDGQSAFVTEYVEGEDLAALIGDLGRPMPTQALVEVVGIVASALATAWSTLSLVHRDVKPSNIRIGRHGNVKLLDFGIARSELDRSAHTQTHLLVGTPRYFAPERYRLGDPPKPAADVFALGCVLYEGVCGTSLLPAELLDAASMCAERARFDQVVRDGLDGLTTHGPVPRTLPPSGATLLRSMLAYEAADRPTHAEVSEAADRLRGELPGPSLAAWCRSRSWADPTPVRSEGTRFQPVQARSREPGSVVEPVVEPARPEPEAIHPPPDPTPPGAIGSTASTAPPHPERWLAVAAGGAAGVSVLGLVVTVAIMAVTLALALHRG